MRSPGAPPAADEDLVLLVFEVNGIILAANASFVMTDDPAMLDVARRPIRRRLGVDAAVASRRDEYARSRFLVRVDRRQRDRPVPLWVSRATRWARTSMLPEVRRLTVASALGMLLASCGGPSPSRQALAIHLSTTKIVAGHQDSGWLVVTNPGPAVDLTEVASTHIGREPRPRVIHCRPEFAVYLSNAKVTQEIGFRDGCEAAPYVIPSGTSRLHFTIVTTYGGCSPPGEGQPPFPACTPFGPPALPTGRYEAKVQWSEHVPLPNPSPVTVTLTP